MEDAARLRAANALDAANARTPGWTPELGQLIASQLHFATDAEDPPVEPLTTADLATADDLVRAEPARAREGAERWEAVPRARARARARERRGAGKTKR